MSRRLVTILLLVLTGTGCSAGVARPPVPQPSIPRPADVIGYKRYSVFTSNEDHLRQVPNEQGDDLLASLDGGRAVESWYKSLPHDAICVIPIPTPYDLKVEKRDGKGYIIHVSNHGELVWLPEGMFVVNEPARARVERVVTWLKEDARQEVARLPRPCSYTVGAVDDGGTLSTIALMFYGDARKWTQIYEANRATIKDPNVITGGLKLTIPNLN